MMEGVMECKVTAAETEEKLPAELGISQLGNFLVIALNTHCKLLLLHAGMEAANVADSDSDSTGEAGADAGAAPEVSNDKTLQLLEVMEWASSHALHFLWSVKPVAEVL